MDLVTVVMMFVILGGIWGGFAYAIWLASKKEESKRKGGGS